MTSPIVLSRYQLGPLSRARQAAATCAEMSLDLGLTSSQVLLEPRRVVFPDGQWLSWNDIDEIARAEATAFLVAGDHPEKIQRFSERFGRVYSLMPTERAPTLLVSGIPMHRTKGIDPLQDTLRKVRTIAPITGRVLDTCTGLGYTAIEAAKAAEEVVTIELDAAVLEVARLNPWSQQLFQHPRIRQVVSDAFEEIAAFGDGTFSRIIHDPPMFSLAGELYSGEFYRQLFRVLQRRGRLFHYIGDPDSRSGRNVARGVVRRLQEAGFSRIVRHPPAFGLAAYK